jgi:medium-chain acyl-[acyl-carrier-protein] hydrolase
MTIALPGAPWLRDERPHAALKLVCLPHAGGGAASFTRWLGLFPPEISPVRVQLPGREDVSSQPPLRRVHEVLAELLPPIRQLVDTPVALYGHSMGALLAFEIARALTTEGTPPVHLFVSGRRAPHLPARKATIHHLPDEQFAAALEDMGGLGGTASPALLRYALPIIRADLEIAEEFDYRSEPKLQCPITAFYGSDDPIVDCDQVEAWAHETRSTFDIREFSGDHFFNQRHRTAIAGHIAAVLQVQGEGEDAPSAIAA